jgi:hypothetical protein
MENWKAMMSMLSGMQADEQSKFAEALETIKTAASMLSRPEVLACLAFLRETAQAVDLIQATMRGAMAQDQGGRAADDDASTATLLYEAINVVSLHDAVKTVAVQDAAAANVLRYAIKAVALRAAARSQTFSEEEIGAIVSEEAAHAMVMVKHAESRNRSVTERRLRPDRRRHH